MVSIAMLGSFWRCLMQLIRPGLSLIRAIKPDRTTYLTLESSPLGLEAKHNTMDRRKAIVAIATLPFAAAMPELPEISATPKSPMVLHLNPMNEKTKQALVGCKIFPITNCRQP
jgi:hypothetical protein